MPKNATDFGKSFREKFNYAGKLTKECMGKELWNEYYKMLTKERNASPEHKKELAERKEQRQQEMLKRLNNPLYKLHSKIKSYYIKYCNDITNVENFELAKIDKFEGWDLHHINGEKMSVADLKKAGLYFNRPADEFVFLKHDDHIRRHQLIKSNVTVQRAKKMIEDGQKMIEKGKKLLLEAEKLTKR